jgi:hypothetical protein
MIQPMRNKWTMAASAPSGTHRREATCEDVRCPKFLLGFATAVPAHRADLIAEIQRSNRSWSERREGAVTVFAFPAGTECFEPHSLPTGRPWDLSIDGQQKGESEWFDRTADHLDRLRTIQERGL